MPKNDNWLDELAQKLGASATKITKTAGARQVVEQVIIDPSKVPNAQNGDSVAYNGVTYRIANVSYRDKKGAGVVLERTAAFEDLLGLNTEAEDGPDAIPAGVPSDDIHIGAPDAVGQEYARRNPGDVYHYEIRDNVEQPSFTQAADATMNDIHNDWQIDRPTVPGHYTNAPQSAQATNVAGAGEGPDVPVAANSTVMGYGYQNMGPQSDPTAPIANMAQEDQKVGFDVGEDWVDPMGHGTGAATPQVNMPHEIGDDYAGAKGTEVPGFVQNIKPIGETAPTAPGMPPQGAMGATPAVQNNAPQRLDDDQPGAKRSRLAPVSEPLEGVDSAISEPATRDDEKAFARDESTETDGFDDMEDEMKDNRVAARLAKMLRW